MVFTRGPDALSYDLLCMLVHILGRRKASTKTWTPKCIHVSSKIHPGSHQGINQSSLYTTGDQQQWPPLNSKQIDSLTDVQFHLPGFLINNSTYKGLGVEIRTGKDNNKEKGWKKDQQQHLGKTQMKIYDSMLVGVIFAHVKHFLHALAPEQNDVLSYIY
jgi:hypothetical protein